ncbi:AI-2E family transporter [Antarcticibacterium arcticum]|uniref:AI-2E family transporter n=1 Tax=Antarcticibacterium arcticum TaxID=2585771 RepID=A0A5B8YMF3_9FLAO|nr:AI-2E family transporter [Antarcticibacterium arcticum]QED38905.1 AI-2E family transporter [Antarcticibacterium arcticum]
MDTLKPSLVRQLFVLLVLIFLGFLIFREMLPYLSGVLGAITLFVILKGFMAKLLARGWKKSLAAGTLLLLSFIGILIPVGVIIVMLSNKIGKAVANSERVIAAIKDNANKLETYLGYDLSSGIDSTSIAGWLTSNLQNLAGGTFNAVIAIGVMYFLLYYMLVNREKLNTTLRSYIPLDEDNIELIEKEGDISVRSNALGIPLVAFFQGIIALIGYVIFGVPDPFFWFAITAIGSMVPFIGSALGFIPVTVLLLASGQNWQAIGVLLYGIVIVGTTDNVVRLYILERISSVHPLITLIGVIVGVQLFGFIGLIFGPLLISLFLLIVKIYKKEYGNELNNI